MKFWFSVFAAISLVSAVIGSLSNASAKVKSKDKQPLVEFGPVTLKLSYQINLDVTVFSNESPRRNSLTGADYLWTDGKVPFVFDSNMPAFSILEVMAAMQEIEMSTYSNGRPCIVYVPRTAEDDYIHISWTSSTRGSTSIGRMGGMQELTVNTAGGRGHDDNLFSLMAVLGLIPEVMRTDRDTFIDININNSISSDPFRILTGEGTSTFDQPFDFESLLLDAPYTYSHDPSEPVIMAKVDGKVMGQAVSLSTGDATLLQNAYHCSVDSSNVINLLGDLPVLCYFHDDTCTLTQSTGDDFDWQLESGLTTMGAGPKADHSSGSGKFAVAVAAGHNGQVARLVTPEIAAGEYCLRTQIYMHSIDMGQLRVTLMAPSVNETNDILNQDGALPVGSWYHMYFTLNSQVAFNIQFEATMGQGDTGDIAIDDVLLYNGQCIEWD